MNKDFIVGILVSGLLHAGLYYGPELLRDKGPKAVAKKRKKPSSKSLNFRPLNPMSLSL